MITMLNDSSDVLCKIFRVPEGRRVILHTQGKAYITRDTYSPEHAVSLCHAFEVMGRELGYVVISGGFKRYHPE